MIKKLLLILSTFYLLPSTLLFAASVEAQLANSEVVQGNMAQLRIVAHGNRAAFPNIKMIGDAKVLGSSQRSNNSISYINGKMTTDRSTSLVLTFAPQHDMTIPAYSVNIDGKIYKTNPIALKVVKANAPQTGGTQPFALALKADKQSVMVGEPLLVSVYFKVGRSVRLSQQPQYQKPDFKGFFTKELGSEKSYMQGNYQVTQLDYLLTPEKEGNFTVGPATAKVGVADTSRRDMFGRFFGTVWTPIASNTIDIEVKPIPEDTDLVGDFTLQSSLDRQKTKANKPVNLTVRIEGEGNLEDFEFPAYDIDGVTVYSDDAKVQTQVVNKHIKSSYVKKFVFISDHDFTIPSKTISVYDTKTKAVKQLHVPSYKIEVAGNKAAVVSQSPSTAGIVQTDIKPVTPKGQDNAGSKAKSVQTVAWWMIAVAFVLGMLVMYIAKLLPAFKRKPSPFKEEEALKLLYGHMSEDKAVEEMVRKLYAKKSGDKSVQIDKKELKAMVERFR